MQPVVSLLRSFFVCARRLRARSALLVGPVLAAAYLLAPQAASANCCLLKRGATPNENSIATLYDIVYILGLIVFVGVVGFLCYSVWRFRASKSPVALQIHGNTKLEIGLTAGAAGLLVILAAVTFIMLPGIVNPPNSDASSNAVLSASLTSPTPPNGKQLTVCVTGSQFRWLYTYGNDCNKSAWFKRLPYSYTEMVVPQGEVVRLIIQSTDVIHAWWIPALGGKVDAVPGFTVYTWFKPLHANELYHGQCAQLCGRLHAFMVAQVKVVTPQQYNVWITRQAKLIKDQNDQVGQLRQELIQQGVLTSSGNF